MRGQDDTRGFDLNNKMISGTIYCIKNICREGVWGERNMTFFSHVEFDICLLVVQVEMLSRRRYMSLASLIY